MFKGSFWEQYRENLVFVLLLAVAGALALSLWSISGIVDPAAGPECAPVMLACLLGSAVLSLALSAAAVAAGTAVHVIFKCAAAQKEIPGTGEKMDLPGLGERLGRYYDFRGF